MANSVNRDSLSRVIAMINGKGGVLKTSTVANVGGLLAGSGFSVLLVDLDPQGNLAEDLGYIDDDKNDEGAHLAQELTFPSGSVKPTNVRPNLDVLVGGPNLETASAALASKAHKDPAKSKLALAYLLSQIADNYDMILIDCPPGEETLQTAAVAAAKWALVPVKSDKSSRKGLRAVAERLDGVLDLNPGIDLLGVVLVDTGSGSHAIQREARTNIAELFGADESVTFTATIRHSEATAQAARERGLLVHELDEHVKRGPKWYEIRRGVARAEGLSPSSAASVADDYVALTNEVVARITAAESEQENQA